MIKTYREVYDELSKVARNTRFIMLSDTNYWIPTIEKVRQRVMESYFEKYKWTLDIFDCTEFAVVLQAWIIQERYREMNEQKLSKDEWLSWPFGQVGLYGHRKNFCVTEEGVYYVEPQNDSIEKIDSNNSMLITYFYV